MCCAWSPIAAVLLRVPCARANDSDKTAGPQLFGRACTGPEDHPTPSDSAETPTHLSLVCSTSTFSCYLHKVYILRGIFALYERWAEKDSNLRRAKPDWFTASSDWPLRHLPLEPTVRFELTACCLQNSCSTTELSRHATQGDKLFRYRSFICAHFCKDAAQDRKSLYSTHRVVSSRFCAGGDVPLALFPMENTPDCCAFHVYRTGRWGPFRPVCIEPTSLPTSAFHSLLFASTSSL